MQREKIVVELCRRCGAKCCKGPSPTITLFDIVRILRYLSRRPEDLTLYFEVYTHEQYVDEVLPSLTNARLSEETRQFLKKRLGKLYTDLLIIKLRKREDKSCIFLNPDYTCSIYPVRPLGCRAYPLKLQGVDTSCLLVVEKVDLSEEEKWLRQYLHELVQHYRLLVDYYIDKVDKLIRLVELLWNIVK